MGDLRAILPDPHDMARELEHVGLHCREDEGDEPGRARGVAGGAGKTRAVAAHQAALGADDEVRHKLGAACIFLEVRASVEPRRELAAGEGELVEGKAHG